MEIILIAAMAQNRVIGRNNKMPWRIPEELRFFKKTTMGYPMIMGRKTFESLPSPLPGRRHIVLSRKMDYMPKGGECATSLSEAINSCREAEKVFIIGGAEIFEQSLTMVTTLILTYLDRAVEGDVYFPLFSEEQFVEESRKRHPNGTEPFTVVTYRRVSSL